jgi:hypothetical protein
MILEEGLNRIRDLHSTDIENGVMGTASTTVVETQTGLQSPVAASELAVIKTTSNKTTSVSYTLPSTTGTGFTYREFGVRNDTDSIDFDRVIFTGIEHTIADDVVIRKTYYYENG